MIKLAYNMRSGASQMRNSDVVILENLFSLELPIHATAGSRNSECGMNKDRI